jgi:hypothetical protein
VVVAVGRNYRLKKVKVELKDTNQQRLLECIPRLIPHLNHAGHSQMLYYPMSKEMGVQLLAGWLQTC